MDSIVKTTLDASNYPECEQGLRNSIRSFLDEHSNEKRVLVELIGISKTSATQFACIYSAKFSYSLSPIRKNDSNEIGWQLNLSKRNHIEQHRLQSQS